MVELVERPQLHDHVAHRVDVGASLEEDLVVVVHVDVLVHHDDALRERQQPERPHGVDHLARMAGIGLADRDDRAVVERACGGQVVVDDLRHGHPDRGQEDPLGGLGEPLVLGRRLADDDRRVDRVAAHRDRGQVEDRKEVGGRVVAGVVAKRALDAELALLDVALHDDLGMGRHLEVDRLGLHQLDRLAAQEAGDHELVDVLGQRRRGRVGGDRVETEGDRDVEALAHAAPVGGTVLVQLPVHEGRALVDLLHPVHADVAAAGARIGGDHGGQRDEGGGVAGPAVRDREGVEVDVVAGQHDLLAGTLLDELGP